MLTIFAALLTSSMTLGGPAHVTNLPAPDPKTAYLTNCRKCHGTTGEASPAMKRMMPKIPNLDAKFMGTLSKADVVAALTKGKGDMKPFGEKLSATEIDAVADYVFTLAGAKPKGK